MIFANGGHPSIALAIDRKVPLTANVLGYEPVGDGSGSYIDDLPRQYLHFLTNFVVQEAGKLWQAIPLNDDGYSIINGESFEDAKDYYDSILTTGLKGAWILGHETQEQVSEVIAQLNRSLDSDIFTNRNGQVEIHVLDTEAALSETFTDVTDVLEGTFRSYKEPAHFFNEVVYRFGKVYIEQITKPTPAELELLPRELADKSEWASGVVSMYNPTSPAIYGQLKTHDMDLPMLRHQPSASLIVRRWLVAYSDEARYVVFEMNLCGTRLELGRVFGLTHFAGVGLTGWTARKLRLIRVVADLDGKKVALECRDVNFTYTDIAA
jgi:hypothetical protein